MQKYGGKNDVPQPLTQVYRIICLPVIKEISFLGQYKKLFSFRFCFCLFVCLFFSGKQNNHVQMPLIN